MQHRVSFLNAQLRGLCIFPLYHRFSSNSLELWDEEGEEGPDPQSVSSSNQGYYVKFYIKGISTSIE